MMRLCAVVVTYYPDINEAINNILLYLPWVDHLIIWENTPKDDLDAYKITLSQYEHKISYMGSGNTEGISFALNRAIEWACANGFTHILTMDQDSSWENFELYRRFVENALELNTIFVPIVNGRKSSIPYIFITSGMVVPLDVYHKIGTYCEDFKVDMIDYEFCIRCLNGGIGCKEVTEVNLIQRFGSPLQRRVFGRTYTCPNYNKSRLFEIVRNSIILIKSYKMSYDIKKRILKQWLIINPILIILFEKNKSIKIFSIIKGFFSGVFHRKIEL